MSSKKPTHKRLMFLLKDSDFLNELNYAKAMPIVIERLETIGAGQGQTKF